MTLFVVVVVGPFLKFLISSFLHSLLLPILSPLVPFDHRSFLLPVPFSDRKGVCESLRGGKNRVFRDVASS